MCTFFVLFVLFPKMLMVNFQMKNNLFIQYICVCLYIPIYVCIHISFKKNDIVSTQRIKITIIYTCRRFRAICMLLFFFEFSFSLFFPVFFYHFYFEVP